jgi:hypothetical protein
VTQGSNDFALVSDSSNLRVLALATELLSCGSSEIQHVQDFHRRHTAQRRLVVEGKLSDPWVTELRTTCRSAMRDLEERKLVIDLSSLTVISREGQDAIVDLMKEGAKFSCAHSTRAQATWPEMSMRT